MSANPFKRNREDRVHFPPLEEALARPGRRTGAGWGAEGEGGKGKMGTRGRD